MRISILLSFLVTLSCAFQPTFLSHKLRPSTTKILHAASASDDEAAAAIDMGDVGFVVLAGGKGSRMKASMPKQFLELRGAPILHYSLDLFLERLPAFLEANGK